MYKGKKICLVIPCLNEEDGIAKTLGNMPKTVDEVIVVDNGSTDNTADVARSCGAKVVREDRRGYGYAYKRGFEVCKADIILTSDGDFTYPLASLDYLLKDMCDRNLDFVTVKRDYNSLPSNFEFLERIMGNIALSLVVKILFRIQLQDSQSGMWLFKRKILEEIKMDSNGMSFSEEIKIRAFLSKNIKSEELSVSYPYPNRIGRSKLSLWGDGGRNLIYLFTLRFSDNK